MSERIEKLRIKLNRLNLVTMEYLTYIKPLRKTFRDMAISECFVLNVTTFMTVLGMIEHGDNNDF